MGRQGQLKAVHRHTRRLEPWSKYALSQSKGKRRDAEVIAFRVVNDFRGSVDWRKLLKDCIHESNNFRPNELLAEALIRELETVSLEELMMERMLRS